jgi:hypothetical protein
LLIAKILTTKPPRHEAEILHRCQTGVAAFGRKPDCLITQNAAVCRRAAPSGEIFLCALMCWWFNDFMFSHIVVFCTDPAQPNAADELLAAANALLKDIPGVLQFHAGKMMSSHRPVVDQSYQVAMNMVFASKQAEHEYQSHPQHVEFVEKHVRRLVKKVVIYDFE